MMKEVTSQVNREVGMYDQGSNGCGRGIAGFFGDIFGCGPGRRSKLGGVATIVLIAILLLGLGAGLGFLMWQMDAKKGEIGLATRYDAQFNVVESGLFKMRATIKNMHNCTDEWADKFIKVVAEQAKGRSGGTHGGTLPEGNAGVAGAVAAGSAAGSGFNIVRESESLGIPQELYLKLSNAIEGQLADFTRQQDTLTDIWREHTAYCKDPYHNWLGLAMAEKVKPKPEMITSQDVKDAVASKKMSENLF